MNIEPYIKSIRILSPLEIKTSFVKQHWLNFDYKNSSITNDIHFIVDNYASGISRQDIISYLSRSDRTLIKGFLMTMIWGHGFSEYSRPDNRGPWKVGQMFEKFELTQDILKNAYESLINNDIENACNSFERMNRCRVSFYSKFLYFLGKAIGMDNYPLIFDARVAKTIGQLISTNLEIFSILDVRQKQDAQSFKTYVQKIHDIASEYKVDADKIEFFLFKGI